MITLTPELCRAARGLLAWGQRELAQRAAISHKTIADFELGLRRPYGRTLRDVVIAFEEGGVVFLPEQEGAHKVGIALRWGFDVSMSSTTAIVAADDTTNSGTLLKAWESEGFLTEQFTASAVTIFNEDEAAELRAYLESTPQILERLSDAGRAVLSKAARMT
jgi:hypothetical protein